MTIKFRKSKTASPIENSRSFIKLETAGANLLLCATVFALLLSNSPWQTYYTQGLHAPLVIHVINDGLMSIFFLVVGLEIKYELVQGSLRSRAHALLPAIAALGGMIVPALIYTLFNHHNNINMRGWAIPTATDIAFSLGVLSLLGTNIPAQLKIFLTALAIFDDLAAIMIIAAFYTSSISWLFLGLALLCIGLLYLLNRANINSILVYCLFGAILWFCFEKAGIHPTLAGVMLAFMMPLNAATTHRPAAAARLKHYAHPLVALGILPLFAFANAGISFAELSGTTLNHPIAIGILFSLLLGKPLGIFSACWIAVKLRIARLPDKVQWRALSGVSLLCGIGFTISLFIGALAFDDFNGSYLASVKVGVLAGSLLSGITGYLVLSHQHRIKSHPFTARGRNR